MARGGPSGRGHRGVPHTADLRIEAWAPTRELCIAEAVTGLVDGFADVSRVRRLRTVELDVPPGPDADLLVSVLDEVIFRLEVEGEIVLDAAFVPSSGGLTARLTVGDVVEATAVGAVPKAVSLHGLRFAPDPASGAWSCAVTVDV